MSPQQTIAHYRITSKLGQGGMGEVWRATDTKLGREVAIKVLPEAFAADADRLARFTREAQVLASLNHPNIAQIYGVEERALVIELVEGATLAERIAQGPVPFDEALAIARQIGDALEAAHEKGIVHRDLKPANIKITPAGKVKVLDFGLAKAMYADAVPGDSVNSPTLTMRATVAGVILGTAGYMAPEQAKGKAVDRRADIWAFGVVLYEMLTGDSLFAGETVSDTLAAVLTKDPDVERIPAPLRKLLRSCLEKDPSRRLRDIGDAWRLLEEAPPPTPAQSRRARPLPWIAAALLAVALAVLAFVHFRETAPSAPLVRFLLSAPQNGAFGNWMALSPDGRYLAFPGSGPDGVEHVWVRSLDSVETRMLAGTEGTDANDLFWSYDSRYLVFQAGSKVRKIGIGGGLPQTLCDTSYTALGGSWNAAGMILLGNASGPLMRVFSAGGTASPITRVERDRGESYHSDPIFLSDGRHFLYFRHSARPEMQGFYLGSLDAKPEQQSLKRIQAGNFSPGYDPPRAGHPVGHLLFLKEESLMAQPFDESRMEAAGEAVPIAERVGSTLSRAFFSVSKTGVLAYRAGGDATLQLTWYDRTGRVLGRAGEPADYQDVAISPDGGRLAFSRPTQGAGRQIWTLDLARGIQTRVTFVSGGARSPTWSPDGRYLAFSSAVSNDLYIKDVTTGGSAEPVLRTDGINFVSQWTPDGRFILYSVSLGAFDVMAFPSPLGGGDRKPVPVANSEFTEMDGQVSPDSRWVAYRSYESGPAEIYVKPFPPGDGRTGKWLVSSAGGEHPHWRGDGKELLYVGPDHSVMAVDVHAGASFESATPRVLFRTPAIGGNTVLEQWDVTRDGKRFLAIGPVEGAVSAPATVVLNWENLLNK
jgi:eukaryotic-like serine/threonine-protein kinase